MCKVLLHMEPTLMMPLIASSFEERGHQVIESPSIEGTLKEARDNLDISAVVLMDGAEGASSLCDYRWVFRLADILKQREGYRPPLIRYGASFPDGQEEAFDSHPYTADPEELVDVTEVAISKHQGHQ